MQFQFVQSEVDFHFQRIYQRGGQDEIQSTQNLVKHSFNLRSLFAKLITNYIFKVDDISTCRGSVNRSKVGLTKTLSDLVSAPEDEFPRGLRDWWRLRNFLGVSFIVFKCKCEPLTPTLQLFTYSISKLTDFHYLHNLKYTLLSHRAPSLWKGNTSVSARNVHSRNNILQCFGKQVVCKGFAEKLDISTGPSIVIVDKYRYSSTLHIKKRYRSFMTKTITVCQQNCKYKA